MFRKEAASLAHALSLTFCSPLITIRVEPSSGVSCCCLPLTFSHSPKERAATEIWPTWSNDALKNHEMLRTKDEGDGKRAAAEDAPAQRTGAWLLWVPNLKRATFEPPRASSAVKTVRSSPRRSPWQQCKKDTRRTIGRPTWLTCLSRPRPPRSRSQRGRVSMRCDASPRCLPVGRTVCDLNFYLTC